MTSYAVSHWESGTIGWQKIFGWRGSACIFAWIYALFTLILLTHKIMIKYVYNYLDRYSNVFGSDIAHVLHVKASGCGSFANQCTAQV